MPKLKTNKTIAKRFKFTAKGKLMVRTSGQNHFNSRESSKVTRNKRRDKLANTHNQRNLRRTLPHHKITF